MLTALSSLRRLVAVALPVLSLGALVGCSSAGTDSAETESAAISSNPDSLNIGFGGAGNTLPTDPFQFGAISHFFAKTEKQPGAHLCHRYLSWDVGLLPAGDGAASNPNSRANFEAWLADASNPCEDVLISFKAAGDTTGVAPTDFHDTAGCATCYGTAFKAFLDTFTPVWEGRGAGHVFSFTAWNEPNNKAPSGNGIGTALSAISSAQYYLMARHLCGTDPSRCKVAAGDLASNGDLLMSDFQKNCPDDTASTLCSGASWLDEYKHFIHAHATDPAFSLPSDFVPEYWAYHPWNEINNYVYRNEDCVNDARCSTKALLTSLDGVWGKAPIWDTEIGSGQNLSDEPDGGALDDQTQARGAAYILYLSSHLTDRIWRVYYQGVETGEWQIMCDDGSGKTRPSFNVLANRATSYTGAQTQTCPKHS